MSNTNRLDLNIPKPLHIPTHTFCVLLGHNNNIHCLAVAVNQLAASMFTIQGKDIEQQLEEFLLVSFN
jgi:hypothetical protein